VAFAQEELKASPILKFIPRDPWDAAQVALPRNATLGIGARLVCRAEVLRGS